MTILLLLLSLRARAIPLDRPPATLACVAVDARGARAEFEIQLHAAVRRFNLFESEGAAQIRVGPFPLMQIQHVQAAFGFGRSAFEVRLGTHGDAEGRVETRGGFKGRFGEAKINDGTVKGLGFELQVGRGDDELHLICARSRDA